MLMKKQNSEVHFIPFQPGFPIVVADSMWSKELVTDQGSVWSKTAYQDSLWSKTSNQDLVWSKASNQDFSWSKAPNQDSSWNKASNQDSSWSKASNQDSSWSKALNQESSWSKVSNQDSSWSKASNQDSSWSKALNQDSLWSKTSNQGSVWSKGPGSDHFSAAVNYSPLLDPISELLPQTSEASEGSFPQASPWPDNGSMLSCGTCRRTFTHSVSLRRHQQASHVKRRPRLCTLCGKTFTRTESLLDHMNGHRNIKAHQCGICSRQFASRANLRKHVRKGMCVVLKKI